MRRRLTTSILVIACALVAAWPPARGPPRRCGRRHRLCGRRRRRAASWCARTASTSGASGSRATSSGSAGYPVIGGEATVVQGPGEPARVAADATAAVASKRALSAPRTALSKPRDRDREARRPCARAPLGDRSSASLAIDPRHGDALVWRVEVPAAQPMEDLEVFVDAGSGRVLAKGNSAPLRDRQGQALQPEPACGAGELRRHRHGCRRRPQRQRHRQAHRPAQGRDPAAVSRDIASRGGSSRPATASRRRGSAARAATGDASPARTTSSRR